MNRQLSLVDLIKAVQDRIQFGSNLICYDHVPDNAQTPLVYAEVVGIEPADSKTMYIKDYSVWVHVISDDAPTSVPVYRCVQEVQEAMTEDVVLPQYVNLVLQTDAGLQTIYQEQDGAKHAVLEYHFKVSYGYKFKS